MYSLDELAALAETVHELGLLFHVDGARIANASAALRMPLLEITAEVGVDVLSFGLTKNGAMGAEAVVVLDPKLAGPLKYIRKQTTQLPSKMRFLAAQVVALGEGDLWLRNAQHANAMAHRLADGIAAIPGIEITQSVDANAVFAMLPEGMTERLQRDFHFYVWNETSGEVRLMTNWATAPDDVDEFVGAMQKQD